MKLHTLPDDELFQVEQKIARRADDLMRQPGSGPGHALECWLQAEREIWGAIAAVDAPTDDMLATATFTG
jgi:hypothetical protein